MDEVKKLTLLFIGLRLLLAKGGWESFVCDFCDEFFCLPKQNANFIMSSWRCWSYEERKKTVQKLSTADAGKLHQCDRIRRKTDKTLYSLIPTSRTHKMQTRERTSIKLFFCFYATREMIRWEMSERVNWIFFLSLSLSRGGKLFMHSKLCCLSTSFRCHHDHDRDDIGERENEKWEKISRTRAHCSGYQYEWEKFVQ